jgi:hypothetical protein
LATAFSRVAALTVRGRGSPGARYEARHRPSAAKYTDPSPLPAFPWTRTFPSAAVDRLPVGFLGNFAAPKWKQPWKQRYRDNADRSRGDLRRQHRRSPGQRRYFKVNRGLQRTPEIA